MKTQTFLLLFGAFFFLGNTNAQFSIGIKASYHNAWQEYGDDFSGNGQKIKGFSKSLTAYYQLGEYFEVGTEAGYIRRGAACEPGFFIDNPYLSGDATLYANYLTAPFFLRAKKPFFKNFLEISVKGGGGPSWLVDAYRELNLSWGPDVTQIIDINLDEETNLRRWDVGLNAGIGLGIHLGPGMVLLEYEYYHSLKDMNSQLTSKNRNAGWALGYVVRI